MSSTLGTGSVALTPINLDTVPPAYEGSKAGLLTLNWALVKASNAGRYAQPLNLLQAYWTGQFTTPQAVLIDNAAVGYPVRLTSQSTGQRVTCPAHGQIMSPLLVSSAPAFLFELLLPPGLVQPVDQVTTRLFFLNTPQTPFQISGASNPVTGQYVQTVLPITLPAIVAPGPSTSVSVPLLSAFTPGTQQITYTSLSVTVTPGAGWTTNPGGSTGTTASLITSLQDGAVVLWGDTHTGTPGGGALQPYSLAVAFPPGLNNTDGLATTLVFSAPAPSGLFAIPVTLSNLTLYYQTTVPPT